MVNVLVSILGINKNQHLRKSVQVCYFSKTTDFWPGLAVTMKLKFELWAKLDTQCFFQVVKEKSASSCGKSKSKFYKVEASKFFSQPISIFTQCAGIIDQ